MESKEEVGLTCDGLVMDAYVAATMDMLAEATLDERVELFREIRLNYCLDCGLSISPTMACYCDPEAA